MIINPSSHSPACSIDTPAMSPTPSHTHCTSSISLSPPPTSRSPCLYSQTYSCSSSSSNTSNPLSATTNEPSPTTTMSTHSSSPTPLLMPHSPPSTSRSCGILENQNQATCCSTFLRSSATSHSLKTNPILLFLSPKEAFILVFIRSNLYS